MVVEQIFEHLKDYCVAIYYGGSRVDPVIDNPHDYDYICFAKEGCKRQLYHCILEYCFKARVEAEQQGKTSEWEGYDFSQICEYPYTQITLSSYLHPLNIRLVGEDICPKHDIINEHREEFIKCLKDTAAILQSHPYLSPKRWYQILRGTYIVLNKSYAVTPEQHREINILHDIEPNYQEVIDKTISLLNTL
jgi:hypothetical protein